MSADAALGPAIASVAGRAGASGDGTRRAPGLVDGRRGGGASLPVAAAPAGARARRAASPARRGRPAPRAGSGLLLVLLALLLAAGPAWPHASLVRSSPARRATLATAPDRVQLWFNEAIEPRFSSVSVWDAAGRQVDLADARVEPEDPKRLSLSLPRLGPGTYRVRFRVLSVDGHVVESEFPFTVR